MIFCPAKTDRPEETASVHDKAGVCLRVGHEKQLPGRSGDRGISEKKKWSLTNFFSARMIKER
jgi:hypothetical protein